MQGPRLTPFIVALVFGLVVGVFGHIIHSRPLIVLGILLIGFVCGYIVIGSYVSAFGG
jgi:F0F1-type ATP synthase assembly protein I